MSDTYSLKITNDNGIVYMSYKGKGSWCKRTAIKHMNEWKRIWENKIPISSIELIKN